MGNSWCGTPGRRGPSWWAVVAVLFSPAMAAGGPWQDLFDGKTLDRWEVQQKYDFINRGTVEVKDGQILLGAGRPGTAVRYTGEMPKTDYEISLEAMRVEGEDFFCCLSFPVGAEGALSLVVGGWGGTVVGLSLIDGEPAAENATCVLREFKLKQWYTIRVRVTQAKVEAWIEKDKATGQGKDVDQIVDFETADHKLTLYFEDESALPLGIATWRTTGAVRAIRLRRLDAEERKKDEAKAPQPGAEGDEKKAALKESGP